MSGPGPLSALASWLVPRADGCHVRPRHLPTVHDVAANPVVNIVWELKSDE